jgi:hypothetical protein
MIISRSMSVMHNQEKTIMFTGVPKSLYFSSGMQPSLADVRDALRKQQFAHNTFEP